MCVNQLAPEILRRRDSVGHPHVELVQRHARLDLSLDELVQSIRLTAAARHFGGVQLYFLCPVLGRRASVLWMPPGASQFACRQAWGRWVAYRSQFRSWQYRALARAQELRFRLGGETATHDFDELPPPRPRFMHRTTFERQLKRLEAYETKCNLYLEKLLSRS